MKIKIQKIALLLLCLIAACNKNTGPSRQQIDPTVKKYFSYKPGTYWIYRDSFTNEIDSFSVLDVGTIIAAYTNQNEAIEIDGIWIYNNGIRDTPGISWQLEDNGISFLWGAEWVSNSIGFGTIYPFKGYDTMYQSYQLYGNTFYNVARYTGADTIAKSIDVFYITSDAGIIKMNLKNPSNPVFRIWELQRYKIVH